MTARAAETTLIAVRGRDRRKRVEARAVDVPGLVAARVDDTWTLTHVKSGRCLARHDHLTKIRALARAVAGFADWTEDHETLKTIGGLGAKCGRAWDEIRLARKSGRGR